MAKQRTIKSIVEELKGKNIKREDVDNYLDSHEFMYTNDALKSILKKFDKAGLK